MRYRFFLGLIVMEALILAALVTAGLFSANRIVPVRRCNGQLVQVFELTDLSIWTGACYTRHPSQADLFSAFQDGMGALERFPEGVLAPLPTQIRQGLSSIPQEKNDEPTS
jgi:hypothetical protein